MPPQWRNGYYKFLLCHTGTLATYSVLLVVLNQCVQYESLTTKKALWVASYLADHQDGPLQSKILYMSLQMPVHIKYNA